MVAGSQVLYIKTSYSYIMSGRPDEEQLKKVAGEFRGKSASTMGEKVYVHNPYGLHGVTASVDALKRLREQPVPERKKRASS